MVNLKNPNRKYPGYLGHYEMTKQKNNRNRSIFSKLCWSNSMFACRRMQIDPYLSPCTKPKSRWIKDLNINLDTLNPIKMGNSFECIGTGDNFFNRTPIAQRLRSTVNKWDLMKLKSFCKAKETVNITKWQPTDGRADFQNI